MMRSIPARTTTLAAITATLSNSFPKSASLLPVLSPKYYRRLNLDPLLLDIEPTDEKLQQLVEAHITNIPFENIAQHGAIGGKQELDPIIISNKILDRNRGGFCFELHSLFGYWLQNELHYPSVSHVQATLFRPNGIGFNCPATHMVLIVEAKNIADTTKNDANSLFLVDVGFGEPPIYPLKYEMDTIQITPDGMMSKLTKDAVTDDDSGDSKDYYVTLHWYKDNEWVPRLRWMYNESMLEYNKNNNKINDDSGYRPLSALSTSWWEEVQIKFTPLLRRVQEPESNFALKMIVCKVSKHKKMTLAGNKLKITGPPRFPITTSSGTSASVDPDESCHSVLVPTTTIRDLTTDDEVRTALYELFGIPLEETSTMDFQKSIQANPDVWSAM